jgi:hypothetical protein
VIKFARSMGSRVALGFGLAALAQLLSLILAGAGHGWVTPFFLSFALWMLFPVTLYLASLSGGTARIMLFVLALIAIVADILLIRGALGERDTLLAMIKVNGALGRLFVVLWLMLWFTWQVVTVRALVKRLTIPDSANA